MRKLLLQTQQTQSLNACACILDLERQANVEGPEHKGRTALLSTGYVLMEGGVPIIVNGICVGALGAAGATSVEDAQVSQAGVNAILAQ